MYSYKNFADKGEEAKLKKQKGNKQSAGKKGKRKECEDVMDAIGVFLGAVIFKIVFGPIRTHFGNFGCCFRMPFVAMYPQAFWLEDSCAQAVKT